MVPSENERVRQNSRSPLSAVPAQTQAPSPSASDMDTHMRGNRIIRTPVSLRVSAHPSLTGPALDFVYITTTERSPAVMPLGTDITIQLQTELVATANEMYRKDMEGHAYGEGCAGKAPERVFTTSPPPFPEMFARANTQKLTDSSGRRRYASLARSITMPIKQGKLITAETRKWPDPGKV
ncbi:hypothetical protein K503DRAFT_776191 [Rhizopogon vinicolor AM-OR11-026]|uniref:Uncharacterized protein n=1 Tax=Rhizopogon vinicolor AM-OR11-026 TaxID=1314800 RepID=A0A1B7MJU6_9AGAM|nr:hypothetical protein K503DRAFT_776191 [Rhizopogon vinicolor AM-OR11-026]